jgi:hypothetical protein
MTIINLLPHQYKTIEYIETKCNNQKGLLLWHHMGTGKTISGLSWLSHIITNYSGKYLIVCPPLIKSQWLITAKKMNITLIKSCLIDYEEFQYMINKNSKEIKNKYLIFDECHKLCDIVHYSTSEHRTYSSINEYITSCKKILLLSGTPFKDGMFDYAILTNICANELIMPISRSKLIEKYGDKEIFEQNKKNPLLFNLIKPIFKVLEGNMLNNTIIPFIKRYGMTPKEVMMSILIVPLIITMKPYINSKVTYANKTLKGFKNEFDNSTGIRKIQELFGNGSVSSINKLLDYGLKWTTFPEETDYSSEWMHILKQISKGLFTFLVLYVVNMVWDEFRTFVSYRYTHIKRLQYMPMRYDDIVDDTKRYISYYKYTNDKNYAHINPNTITFRSVLSFNTIMITVLFFYGKVEPELLSFITGQSVKDLSVDSNLVLSYEGFETYGRVLSNLPEFVYNMVQIPLKKLYSIDDITGVVSMNGISKKMIKEQSSSKFVRLGDWITKTKKKKKYKIAIYSDYVEQGACLLSSYFSARGIKHMYLSNMLSVDKQTALLTTFNADFNNKIIILDKNSSEGISLLNVKELHFLEPSINSSVKNQVIGRAIRFQSHFGLEENDRKVNLYIHSSSIFQEEKEKIPFLQQFKTMNLKDIIFDPIINLGNSFGDNNKIDKILHEQKFKYFENELQTTFHHKLDEYLGLNVHSTVQGTPIRAYRKRANVKHDDDNEDDKDEDEDDNASRQTIKRKIVVLSVDEYCEYENPSIRMHSIEKRIKEQSVIEDDYKIPNEHKCRKSNKIIKKQFGTKRTLKKNKK